MFGAIKMVAFVFWTTKRICPYELAELVVAETPGALSNIVQVNIDDRFTYNILINWYHVTFVAKDRWYPTPYYHFYGIFTGYLQPLQWQDVNFRSTFNGARIWYTNEIRTQHVWCQYHLFY